MISKYPNLSLTLLLLLLLVPPFLLRYRYGSFLEPYPAILLPSGAGTIDIKSDIAIFNRISIEAKKQQDSSWSNIDKPSFLSPIPIQYSNYILQNQFGLDREKIAHLPFGIKVSINKTTEEEAEDAKKWLAERLVSQKYLPDELKISSEKIFFNLQTGKIIEKEKTDDKILRLRRE